MRLCREGRLSGPDRLTRLAEAANLPNLDDMSVWLGLVAPKGTPRPIVLKLQQKVAQILAMRKYGYIDPATTEHVRHVAFFYGGATRAGGREGWVDFIPNYFSEIPLQIERGQIPADVVFSMASPMDAEGRFAISLGADYTMAAIAKARAVVLEVNPNVPYAFGNCHVHISQVAALVERSEPVLEVGLPKIGPVQQAIAEHVAHLIEDGATWLRQPQWLVFVPVPEGKTVKNRLHIDLRPDDQAAEVERLLALGARRTDIGQGEQPWVVLVDPEGNEFCVLATRRP